MLDFSYQCQQKQNLKKTSITITMRFMSFVQQTISANHNKTKPKTQNLPLYCCCTIVCIPPNLNKNYPPKSSLVNLKAICGVPVLPVLPFEGWNLHLIRQRPLRGSPRLANESGAGDWKSELFKSTEWKDQKRQQLNTLFLCTVFMIYIYIYITFLCVYVCKHIFQYVWLTSLKEMGMFSAKKDFK